MTETDERVRAAIRDLVIANHILGNEGVVEYLDALARRAQHGVAVLTDVLERSKAERLALRVLK